MAELVSIIVPVHNAEAYIEQTVSSVLNQTYPDWELILVENGSTDGTVKLLTEMKDQRIRVMIAPKGVKSAAGARNAGVAESIGRYVCFLDADDLWKPDKLSKQIAFMKERNAAFSFTGYEFGDEEAKPTGKIVKVPETITYKKALSNTTIFTSTVMFDTALIKRDAIRMPEIASEDTALWWQVLRNGYLGYGLNENLVIYRRPARSLSSNKMVAISRIWNLYRKWEHFGVLRSSFHMFGWAVRAVLRRI